MLLVPKRLGQRCIEQRRALAHQRTQGLGHGEHLTHGWHGPDQHVTDPEALLQQGEQSTLLPHPALQRHEAVAELGIVANVANSAHFEYF